MIDLTEAQRRVVASVEAVDEDFYNSFCNPVAQYSKSCASHEIFLRRYHQTNETENALGVGSDKSEHNALSAYNEETKLLLEQLNSSKGCLSELLEKYEIVAQKTSSLHEACDTLMADQTKLAAAAEEIRHRLTYFDHVDQICTKLMSPLLSVTGESFLHILASIDESMTFLSQQKDYKESSIYFDKCQQCLAKALSRIKKHVVDLLSTAARSVQAKTADEAKNRNEDSFTLFYGLFATHAPPIKSLMDNLERKWDKNVEYQKMLNDCYAHYFAQREILLMPSVRASMKELVQKHSGACCYLIRSGCSFLIRLCEDEQHLFSQFFSRSTDQLHDFLEKFCRQFYDIVRPIVVHAPHLETLSEVCTIMKVEMLDERCALDPDVYSGFVRVISELVGDAGERLVYRAQMYAKSDILDYKPAPGDLAYPDKLLLMESITRSTAASATTETGEEGNAAGVVLKRQSSVTSVVSATSQEVAFLTSSTQNVSAADLHGLWYPTVRRTIMCLSKLFKCLDGGVFQGVSEELIQMCIQSLETASARISSEKGYLNGQLFFIKHLLILREQTSPFRGSCAVKEASMDFSRIKDNAMLLFQQKSRWFTLGNNSLLAFMLQIPANVFEHTLDSRKTLDLQLRDSCQQFISKVSGDLTKSVGEFLQKADIVVAVNSRNADNPLPLSQQTFAAARIVRDVINETYKKIQSETPLVRSSLSTYICNKDTENILFAPIRKNVESVVQKFIQMVRSQYNDEEQGVIGCPSVEEISFMLSA